MVTVIGTMTVVTLLSVAALGAVGGDLSVARGDQDSKRAYDAAQAGVAWYRFQLNRDPAYWTRCTNVPNVATGHAPVNQINDIRYTAPVPGTTDATYAIEIIPNKDSAACVEGEKAALTALQDKTLRIRSTGYANGKKRSVIAVFKRRSFLDFLYYSKFETQDPVTYTPYDSYYSPSVSGWAAGDDKTVGACARPYNDALGTGRGTRRYVGVKTGNGPTFAGICGEIQWVTNDKVNGPLHTEDQLLVCGSPVFGRSGDRVEILDATSGGVRGSSTCGAAPTFTGNKIAGATNLDTPPDNTGLAKLAVAPYVFTGQTKIQLNGTSATVTNNGVTQVLPLPPTNGVIYVKSGSCGVPYSYYQRYNDPVGCGNVEVSGTYSSSMTIGSDNDIIIRGDLKHQGDSLLGLIAQSFVRVYHPVAMNLPADPPNGPAVEKTSCDANSGEVAGSPLTVQIDAAILALNHSFIVDNYSCGDQRQALNVFGSISQRFRGPVGTSAGTGYVKNYVYDDRLSYKEPPNFLDPVRSSWRTVRVSELGKSG